MPITALGQLYTPKNAAEIRDQLLRDLRLSAIDAGIDEPPVQPGTDWFLLATAVANECLIGFANQAIGLDASNILTATGPDLDAIRDGLGIDQIGPSGSSGKTRIRVDGSVTIPNGTAFLLPNGKRGQTVGVVINPSDEDEIDVESIDTGDDTNLGAGEIVRFVSPPTNLRTEATVSTGAPLSGGSDGEDPNTLEGASRMRQRILDTLRNKPAGGNWSHVREIALESLGSVVDCYVYPAPGGPGSAKVVPVRDFDIDNNDYSRALSSAALQTVRTALQAQLPTPQEIVVEAASDVEVDFTLKFTLPDSSLSGGNGLGWIDPAPWPPLVVADSSTVTITAVTSSNDGITVDAATTTAPIAGLTHIAWWSTVDLKFYTAAVISQTGATTAWVLTLDRALVSTDGSGPSIGDYVCPAAQNLDLYGKAWVDLFRSLGPGEVTTDANRIPRAKRHPFVASEDPSDISATTLAAYVKQFPEITDYATGYSSATAPSVPATVADAVQILVPRKFAVYQQ